jgi:hypothetical protein
MNTCRTALGAALAGVVALTSACGGSNEPETAALAPTTLADSSAATASTPASSSTASPGTASPTTEAPVATTEAVVASTEPASESTSTTTIVDDGWTGDVEAACDSVAPMAIAIEPNDGTAESMAVEIAATKSIFDVHAFEGLEVPPAAQSTLDRVTAMGDEALTWLAEASARVTAGDLFGGQQALDEGFDRLVRTQTAWAIAGAKCALADPQRVANAETTVALEMAPWQIAAGFDSLWVSEMTADDVVRLDPRTGDVIARIPVGEAPVKAQPADGRLWVRTGASYDAIDPATNTVVASIAKSDVGPSANRSWALDGAMWICDGRRLHRYDPATSMPVATIDLEVDCSAVYATDDLVVAWNYNEDAGESGTAAAAFVDPSTNTVMATTALPVDVGGPAVLDGVVYFPGHLGRQAVVVDRASWEVTDTPDMGGSGGGTGQAATDGKTIYIVDESEDAVLLIDASTFAPAGTIEPLGVNAVAIIDDALWTASGAPFDAVQRFDTR